MDKVYGDMLFTQGLDFIKLDKFSVEKRPCYDKAGNETGAHYWLHLTFYADIVEFSRVDVEVDRETAIRWLEAAHDMERAARWSQSNVTAADHADAP